MHIKPILPPSGDVLIYEFGVRLDKDCQQAAGDQIFKARRLYNALVASIRDTVTQMRAFVIDRAGPEAQRCQSEVDALNHAFDAARAVNNEEAMKRVAEARREKWRELATFVAAARKAHRAEIQTLFLSRIGKNEGCETYRLRSQAVAAGLGWATANAVLDAAIVAFKASFARGKAPRFASSEDKDQDTLTLQFTAAGGVSVGAILGGGHTELALLPTNGCGKRKYGEFRFRLGLAAAGNNATGTWQYHRPLPEDASIGLARLVRRRIGKDYKWAIQLQVKLKRPPAEVVSITDRKPLVAVHFGWSYDIEGRRVAGITDGPDPGEATVLKLPPEVEERLDRASKIQSERDSARDAIAPRLREIDVIEIDPTSLDGLAPDAPENLLAKAMDELKVIRRLPAQHVALRRLHRLCAMLRRAERLPEWLEAWRKDDRLRWQAHAHIARRARNQRKDFYRRIAIDLTRRYSTITIEPLDLAAAAQKVDENTGERTEFAKKARAGRVVAALYEFESAIRMAAAKTGTALLEISGETASCCATCGGAVLSDKESSQILHCSQCGADLDRKQNGAALAWQHVHEDIEGLVAQFWSEAIAARQASAQKQAEKKSKMADGRRNARTRRGAETAEGSRRGEEGGGE